MYFLDYMHLQSGSDHDILACLHILSVEEPVGIALPLGIIHLCLPGFSFRISSLCICQPWCLGSRTMHFINKKGLKKKALVS